MLGFDPNNLPSSIEEVQAMKKTAKFQLAHFLFKSLWSQDQRLVDAFLARSDDEQAADLWVAINNHKPMAVATPTVVAPTPMQQPVPVQEAAPARSPSTSSDPTNVGAKPGNGTSTPAVVSKPDTNGGSAVLTALAALHSQQKKILDELENCAGQGNLDELHADVKGMLRMQETNSLMVLLLAEHILETPRGMFLALIMKEKKDEALKHALGPYKEEDSEGKD